LLFCPSPNVRPFKVIRMFVILFKKFYNIHMNVFFLLFEDPLGIFFNLFSNLKMIIWGNFLSNVVYHHVYTVNTLSRAPSIEYACKKTHRHVYAFILEKHTSASCSTVAATEVPKNMKTETLRI